MVGRARPHAGGRPRVHRGRQHAEAGVPRSPTFSRRRGSSWTPRRMDPASSSSSGSPSLLPVKPEPQDAPISRRTRSCGIRITESSPISARLVRPRVESGLPAEYEAIARSDFSDKAALKWARDDYLRGEMVRQRRALQEIAARQRGREDENGVVILDSDEDEDAPGHPTRRASATLGRGAAGTAAAEQATTTTTAATTRSSTGASACRASGRRAARNGEGDGGSTSVFFLL